MNEARYPFFARINLVMLLVMVFIGSLLVVPRVAFSDDCPSPLCAKPYAKVTSMNVMAPLCLRDILNYNRCDGDSATFLQQLKTAKAMGVTAVSVDIWWGLVEKDQDQVFRWDYYDWVVKAIQDAGLHWVPILSFHKCGENYNDRCDIPIPKWIWTHYKEINISPEDLKYESEMGKSETGNLNEETVSLWMDKVVMNQYEEFMKEFVIHFAKKAGVVEMTDEINISMGPAGELRYPSYNSHDGWKYPHRGFFQAYSKPAREDFRRYVLNKYGTLSKINVKWNIKMTDTSQIAPPQDSPLSSGRANYFINRRDYIGTQYGRDFIDWYNGALLDHGKRMLESASKTLSGPFANKELGFKIPGIHWQMCDNAPQSRIAEITGGLIRTSTDYSSDSTGHGYADLFRTIAAINKKRKTTAYFTCLEKDNSTCQDNSYSLAKALVFWVSKAANTEGVTIKGENAGPEELKQASGWRNIENAFCYAPYSGITILRINDVTERGIGTALYKCLIKSTLP